MNLIINKYKLILIVVLITSNLLVLSQQKVNVITKTIKKDLKQSTKSLVVKGEKASININPCDKDYFSVEIKLVSKNPNKKDAETDINIIKYEIEENNGECVLKNYFASDKFGNVKSNLSVIYTINVPRNAKLDITNIYGNVYINNLNAVIKLKNSFGEIHISNIKGKQWLNAYYSDVYAKDLDLDLVCVTDKSNIEMTNVSGTIVINSNYGNLRFLPGNELLSLEVDSKRTTVSFESNTLNKYNFALSTIYSNIDLPNQWSKKITKESGTTLFKQINNPANAFIKIKTTYCQISIINK